MSFVNHSKGEINFKLVYWGPALVGKTTNLEWLHRRFGERQGSKMVCLATQRERALFFDFCPAGLPRVQGLCCRFHLYAVPGAVFYDDSRRLILRGVDALVAVVDSQAERMLANVEVLEKLERMLEDEGRDLDELPHVLQYNKRDLPSALPVERLRDQLNLHRAEDFEAVARTGQGVEDSFRAVAHATVARARGLSRTEPS